MMLVFLLLFLLFLFLLLFVSLFLLYKARSKCPSNKGNTPFSSCPLGMGSWGLVLTSNSSPQQLVLELTTNNGDKQ